MQIAGTHPFVFKWGNGLSLTMMKGICTNFSAGLSRIKEDLTGRDLIEAIEDIREEALRKTCRGETLRSLNYLHESRKLALLAYEKLSGQKGSPDTRWVELIDPVSPAPAVSPPPQRSRSNDSSAVIIPNMNLTRKLFIFKWNSDFDSPTVRNFCIYFGKKLHEIPQTDNRELLIGKIESARKSSLSETFRGDTPRNRKYIDLSDQIAVIALAIRLGHNNVTEYEAAQEITGLNNLRQSKPAAFNGVAGPSQVSLANRARLEPLNPAEIKNILEIAERAKDKIYTKENIPKPDELKIIPFGGKADKIPSYTFLNGDSRELIGTGKLLRILPGSCVFQLDGTLEQKSVSFYSYPLIIREIKPEEKNKPKLKESGHYISFNPSRDGLKDMKTLSEGEILKVKIDSVEIITGKYFDYHVSDSGNLIIWFKDGRCIQARNNEVIIHPFKTEN